MKFVIQPNCSIVLENPRRLAGPGTVIEFEGSGVGRATFDTWIRDGFLVPIEYKVDKEAVRDVIPGATKFEPVPSGDESPVRSRVEEPPAKITLTSPWTLDPSSIQHKTLEALNVMVLERDAEIEPFETKEEAVAWLSQDFES